MSGPAEGINTATGVSGTNNLVQTDNINVIGQQINQINLPPTSLQESSILFDIRKPVESFTGRSRELEDLHKLVQRDLEKNKNKLTVISQVTSISGLGGIGKSELVRMYAHEHCKNYDDNVIWINAATYATLKESFHRLADELNILAKCIDGQEKDIKSIVRKVYKYFSKRKSLFIFDNADKLRAEKEGDDGIDAFLPNCLSACDNEPYVIITSRNQKWGKTIKVLQLNTFTEKESIEFIKKELGISDDLQEKEMLQLATRLQYFPLALQQAVAYIKQTDEKLKCVEQKFEIADYLKRYEEKARKLLNFDFPEDNNNCYTKTTFITWEVTLEKIKQNKYGQQALEVLETIAYFSPDNIPTKLFLRLVKGDTEKLASILQLPAQYSMFNLDKGVINIHRLLQHVLRLMLEEQQNEKETLGKTLEFIFAPMKEKTADSSKCLSHAISVWNHSSKHDDKNLIIKLIEVSSLITYKLIEEIRFQDAYAFAIQILELKDKLKINHFFPLNEMYNMATVLSNESMLEIFKEVYRLIKCVLGAEHSSSLLAKYNIAFMLHKKGKYDEALGIYEQVLEIRERVLGAEHPDTLMTRNNIATVLHKQGKYDKAFEIYKQVLNIRERVSGTEHPTTLTIRNNMAKVLHKQGKYDETFGIYEHVLNIQEHVLGAEHPSTLTTRHNMAKALHKQGKYEEAFGTYEHVFNIQKHILGAEHPSALTTRHNMARTLHKQGKYDEAFGIYEHVLNIQEHVLGAEHPDSLMTRNNIGLVLHKQGKYDEAFKIYEHVLNIQENVLGPEHPDSLMTRNNIGLVLHKQGKYDEAFGVHEQALNIFERVLGAEHPSTLMSRNNMAKVLHRQGRYDEAFGIYEQVLHILERVLGEEHPSTLMTRNNMALVLDNQGKYNEAFEIYKQLLSVKERVLGAEHPSTLTTRKNMTRVLHKQGKHGEECALGAETPDTQRHTLGAILSMISIFMVVLVGMTFARILREDNPM